MDAKKKETEKAAQATAAATKTAAAAVDKTKAKSALELLEEDDEFEVNYSCFVTSNIFQRYVTLIIIRYDFQEFEGGSWNNQVNATEDAKLWQDDWEDDNVDDDFTTHLRAQIEARKAAEGK